MQDPLSYSPLPQSIQRIQAYVTSTATMHGSAFLDLLKNAAMAIWEDTRQTPERVLAELQSYGVVEVISLTVSVVLLAIVFLVAAANTALWLGAISY